MLNIFSTREIAIAVWIAFTLIICLFSPKIRKSIQAVVKAACTPKLYIPFTGMVVYAAFFVFLLKFIPFWKWKYIKDITIWVLFAGIPACYKAVGDEIDKRYFRNMFLANLKFVALIEFIVSTFTFSLIAELLIVPSIIFLALLDAIASTKPEYTLVKKLTSFLILSAGFAIIALSLKEAISSYQTLGAIDLLVSFCIPIIFSALYIPVAYGFAVYAKYEMLFIRMSFKEPNDKKVKRNHRIAVLRVCKLSYKKIVRFEQEYIANIYISMKQIEFDDLIKSFKASFR